MAEKMPLVSLVEALVSSSKYTILAVVITCLTGSYIAFSIIYRLYFSPPSHFPGPKIAAVSSIGPYYHDVILGGKYLSALERLHKTYGPIVRTKPNMVHINDPEFIHQLYTGPSRMREKTEFFCNGVPNFKNVVAFATQGHELHKQKRAPLSAFFSKKSARRIEPIVHDKVSKILEILRRHGRPGTPVNLRLLYTAANNDIITEYSFGKSWDSLTAEDLNEEFFHAFHNFTKAFHVNCYHPWVFRLMISLPQWILAKVMPALETARPYFAKLSRHVEELKAMDKSDKGEKPTVIRGLLDSKIPDEDKTTMRLATEGQHLLAGGTDSSSYMLATITYHLLANPDKLAKLKKELESVMPDENVMPECMAVETLPYLNAVIRETFRMHTPVAFTMERIAPEEELEYKSPKDGNTYVIPRGVILGMTPILLGRIESLYPEPDVFRPERFIENPDLERFQMPFGRGTRRCLGENLATAELCVLLAAVFRKFEVWDGTGMQKGQTMELYDTGREDVDMASAFILPFIKEGRKGVRVVVRNGST